MPLPCHNLASSAAPFRLSADAALLAAFGPPSPPDGLVRVVKDVLMAGEWHTSAGVWRVTREKLAAIASNFKSRLGRGNAVNLVNTHGDPATGTVHPEDIVAPIDAAIVLGDTLWVSAYVTPDDAARLKRRGIKVSVRGAEKWRDGDGIECGPCLLHVAIVDLPVIGRQGQFKDLAQGGQMDPLIEAINMLLSALELEPLPEGTEVASLPDVIKGMAIGMGASTGETETETETSIDDTTVLGDIAGAGGAAGTDPMLSQLQKQIKDLSQQVASLRTRDAKSEFDLALGQLGAAGVPAASLESARRAGEKHGFDLSILEPLKGLPTIDMSRHAKRFATATAAGSEPKKRTPEEIKADAALLR